MADQQGNRQSVFSTVMKSLKRGRKDNNAVTDQRGIITNAPIVGNNSTPFVSYQQKQQEFLDVQSSKIAQDLYSRSMYYETDRLSAYQDYKSMDTTPEISAALDIIADECVTKSEHGEVLSIYSENTRVKGVLHDLFYNVLNVGHNLGVWSRELIKYGDLFLRLEIDQNLGIYDVRELPVNEIHREEAWDGNTSSARFRWETNSMYFEEFQVAHFRLVSDTSKLPYGRCLKYDTYIETEDGFKFIKDINVGDIVSTFNINTQQKEKTKVLDVICSGQKEIYKIRTRNNEIESSEEHNFLVYKNGEFVYKQVSDLNINDLLVINKKTDEFILTPIISIEKTEEICDVYDIHVESENHNFYANGIVVHNSILDPARKLWKQLQLAEDAMLVYRVIRAPERRVFFIEVGNIDPNDVGQYIEKAKAQIKKSPMVNPSTGSVNLKYNPISYEEDYFLPIRGDKSSRIETLPGASNLSDIEDIEYLQNKLFAALKVPKPYLNYAESMPGGSALSQADLRFSRTINRLQDFLVMELRRIANIHLHFLGFDDDLDNFTLALTNPSSQQELLKLETMKARLEVFKEMFTTDAASPVSYTWAMQNIMGFSEAEIKQILRQKKVERKMFSEIEGATNEYKETGIFYDLDKKFRREDYVPGQNPTEGGESSDGGSSSSGGGFGGGSSLSGLGGGLGGGIGDIGGGTEPDLGGGAEPDLGGGAEETTSEAGGSEPETETPEETAPLSEKKNTLLNKNKLLNHRTKMLLENMEKFMLKDLDNKKNNNDKEIL